MKRKEWIKNFAIIFLAVLLVLTFFSNTIRNYSLPEVAAQYTQSGQITNKVRGQGTVESSDPYKVEFKQSRKIDSVKVRVGDEVEKGDVLYELEAGESEELKAAQSELRELENQYYDMLIGEDSSVVNAATSGTILSDEEKLKKISAIQKNIESYEDAIEKLQKEQDSFLNGTPAYVAEKKQLEDAKTNLDAWTTQRGICAADELKKKDIYDEAKAKVKEENGDVTSNDVSSSNPEQDVKDYKTAKENYENAQKATKNADSKVDEYNKAVANAQTTIDNRTFEFSYQIKEYQRMLDNAKEDLNNVASQSKVSNMLAKIAEKKEEVQKLKDTDEGMVITSPVSGTVLSMAYTAGEETKAGEAVATIQVAGKGYTLTMNITNDQAQLIRMGDEAEVTNSWWYTDVQARVVSLRPDPQNPGNGKIVTFELSGDVSNGQSLTLTVGSRTANYDCIVPTNAIKEDNNGKFIYRVVSKSTPLGNRYSVERVDVKILASDEKQSAVSGDLEGWDYIVTSASKPIEDGQLVRLKD